MVKIDDGTIITKNATALKVLPAANQTHQKQYTKLNPACSTYLNPKMRESKFITDLKTLFETECKGKSKCSIKNINIQQFDEDCQDEILKRAFASKDNTLTLSFDPTVRSIGKFDIQQAIYSYNASVPEPIMYILGQCKEDFFQVRMTSIKMKADQVGVFLVVSDVLIIIVLILGFNFIYHMQKDFAIEYDQETI